MSETAPTVDPHGSPDWDLVARDPDTGGLWAPDLFAWVYDQLSASEGWRLHPQPEELEHDPQVIVWRDTLRRSAPWVRNAEFKTFQLAIDGLEEPNLGLLKLLVAIDRAFDGARLTRPRPSHAAKALLEHWEKHGHLQQHADGLVLRKGSYWRAGRALAHYCSDLARVSPPLSNRFRIHVRHVSTSSTLGALLRSQGDDARVRVAFVPTLTAADDMSFRAIDRPHAHLFSVELNPKRQAELTRGAPDLIARLESDGVNLALLPETVVHEECYEALQAAVVDNNLQALRDGRRPNLRLLAVGIAGERSNTVAAIDGDGHTLFRQLKTQPWTLDRNQLERYALDGELGSEPRVEDIDGGIEVHFSESPGLGRMCVLICEDLARVDPSTLVTLAATANLVLSPVCDGSLAPGRWAHDSAKRLADEPGALTLVTNSFVLANRQAEADTGSPALDVGVGIALHPDDWDQSQVVLADPAGPDFLAIDLSWFQAWG